jgi:hypothetical protein
MSTGRRVTHSHMLKFRPECHYWNGAAGHRPETARSVTGSRETAADSHMSWFMLMERYDRRQV